MTEKEIREAFKRHDKWLGMASECEHSWQQFHGVPASLPTCRLTNDVCSIENCPKVIE